MLSLSQDLVDTLTEKIVDQRRYVRPADVERDEDGSCTLTLRAVVDPEAIREMLGEGKEVGKEDST